jgi:alpha-aminoadipate carrier protein LysW
MTTADCDECGYNVELTDTIEGELILCPECGTDLEVVSLDPPKLDPAPAEEEDWGE